MNDAQKFLNCITSLKLVLQNLLNSGQKWMIVNTESLILKETLKTKIKLPEIVQKTEPAEQMSGGIVLVRLCPAEIELHNGIPYSDDGGKFIVDAVMESGIKSELIYKTYLCKFPVAYLAEDSMEIAKWTKDFYEEMAKVKPDLIICLGERVSQIICNVFKPIDEIRKMQIKNKMGFKMFCFYDPMYILKKKQLKNVFIQELRNHELPTSIIC